MPILRFRRLEHRLESRPATQRVPSLKMTAERSLPPAKATTGGDRSPNVKVDRSTAQVKQRAKYDRTNVVCVRARGKTQITTRPHPAASLCAPTISTCAESVVSITSAHEEPAALIDEGRVQGPSPHCGRHCAWGIDQRQSRRRCQLANSRSQSPFVTISEHEECSTASDGQSSGDGQPTGERDEGAVGVVYDHREAANRQDGLDGATGGSAGELDTRAAGNPHAYCQVSAQVGATQGQSERGPRLDAQRE